MTLSQYKIILVQYSTCSPIQLASLISARHPAPSVFTNPARCYYNIFHVSSPEGMRTTEILHTLMVETFLQKPPSLHVVLHLQWSTSEAPEQWEDLPCRQCKLMDGQAMGVSIFRHNFIPSLFRSTAAFYLFIPFSLLKLGMLFKLKQATETFCEGLKAFSCLHLSMLWSIWE